MGHMGPIWGNTRLGQVTEVNCQPSQIGTILKKNFFLKKRKTKNKLNILHFSIALAILVWYTIF